VSPQKHIGVSIPCGTSTLSFLFVRKSKFNSEPEEAIATCKTRLEQSEAKNNTIEIDINY
jgi:hypothetical protein